MNSDYREPAALELIERLKDLCYTENRIGFGHQNAGHIGISIKERDGYESDVKNICGKQPLVVGVDTLSFYGYEGKYEDLVKIVKNLNKQGIIVVLTSHMPNLSLGGDQFFDYSPTVIEGNVPARIMPGGDLNAKFLRFLNKIADFCEDCIDVRGERIPMIFRPFHEDNGSWFWWGKAHLGDKEFIELFRYTIDYLRNTRGIRSLVYSYSPNGEIHSPEEYMARYPGDDYVDLMGLDYYYDRPAFNFRFYKDLLDSLECVRKCAERQGKVYALTETGIRVLETSSYGSYYEGLAPFGNTKKDWFTELLDVLMKNKAGQGCAFLLFWANFSDQQFWIPYVKDDFRHEMVDDFMKFITDERIVMAPGEEEA